VDLSDPALERGALNLILDFATMQSAFEGCPFGSVLAEFREIPPGVDAVPE
jgi:hypothetical protein